MMAKEYALGTIKIFISAVSFYFKMKGWQAPYTNERFQMTMQGIARDIGDRKIKKPPVEARHVAALMGMERPSEWTLQQWLQGKVMVLWGWQLFNRRQDFGRFQPCDVRFSDHGCQMLIRYAKNDVRGRTREPSLEAVPEMPGQCPRELMREYMRACGIEVCRGCNKEWGQPYPCDVCPPLFPTILKYGVQDRCMPDGRVTTIVKGMMVALARARPDILSVAEAGGFSAKSLRTGGTSESAALEIREGVMQGHGGWAARKSLDSYDQMKGTEARVVSHALNEAVLALGPLGQEALRRREAARVAGQVAHQADVDAGLVRRGNDAVAPLQQAPDSESEEDLEWKVLSIVGTRGKAPRRFFQVLWAATADAGEVKTWEPEEQLVEDGWGPDIEVFEAAQVASSKRTKAAARRAAASSRTEAAAQQSGSAASRKRNRLLKELDSTLLL